MPARRDGACASMLHARVGRLSVDNRISLRHDQLNECYVNFALVIYAARLAIQRVPHPFSCYTVSIVRHTTISKGLDSHGGQCGRRQQQARLD